MTIQDDSATPPIAEPSPGQRLRAAREALGLGTADVAAKLKLSVRQVEAIEADDWSALPERPFARGFFRNYARLVSIDPDTLGLDPAAEQRRVAGAAAALDIGTQLVSPAAASERLPVSGRKRSPLLIPVSLAVILIAGALYLHQSDTPPSLRPQSVWPTAAPPAPERAASPSDTDTTSATVSVPAPVAATEGSPPPGTLAGVQNAAPVAGATEANTAPSSVLPQSDLTPPNPASAVHGSAKPREGEAVVRLTFSGRSWTEVRSNGEVVFSETASPGTREFTAPRPLSFIIGNASAVKLEIDGKPHDFAASTRSDVARFQIP